MQSTARRTAKQVSALPLDKAAAQLLPPLLLYRRLLCAHKKLPFEMRTMGDGYVKAEFRRHAGIDNPLHIIGFLGTWKTYLDQIESDTGIESLGKRLEPQTLEKLSSEQVAQLFELMQATKDVYNPNPSHDSELEELTSEAGVGSQGGSSKE